MASSIDERIVQMTFNNKEFEKGASETIKTLGRLERSLKMDQAASGFSRNISRIEGTAARVDLTPISKGIQNIEDRFSSLGVVGMRVLQRLTDAAIDASVRFAKSISVDNIGAGQSKYETQTKAVQTITNATGKSVADVEKVLARLAKYTDETSYDFSTMVSSIGKFTSVGVDLDLAEKAMEGIANEAAKSGAGIQEANRAMYNFAQALSAGYVKLIDWKSIENANMATKEFKEQLINTAIEMGTLKKSGENVGSIMKQVAKATKTTAAKFKETKVNYKSFNETLSEGWLTSDVLIKTLEKYSDTSTEFGLAAYHAAQEALTFTDAINAVKDAVSSSWMQSFKYMFGDLDEARVLWTKVANSLYDFVAIFSEARNELLEGWHNLGGYNTAVEAASNLWHAFYDTLILVKSAWETVLPPVTAERLVGWTRKIRDFTRQLNKALGIKEEVEEEVADATASVTASSSLDTKAIQNEINYAKKLNESIKIGSRGKDVKALQELLQRGGYLVDKYGADGIYGENTKRAVKALQKELGVSVTGAWDKATKQATISKKIFVSTFTSAENARSAIEKSTEAASKATGQLVINLDKAGDSHTKLAEDADKSASSIDKLSDSVGQLIDYSYGLNKAMNEKTGDPKMIERLQKRLVQFGYLADKSFAYGIYGPETKEAVKNLQRDLSIAITGEWNEETWRATKDQEKFTEQYRSTNKEVKKNTKLTKENAKAVEMAENLKYALNKAAPSKRKGNRFEGIRAGLNENYRQRIREEYGKNSKEAMDARLAITELENILKRTGYLSKKYITNGIYGPEIKAAVKKLQKDLGVNQTGIFDKATKKAAISNKKFDYFWQTNENLKSITPRIELVTKGLASIVSIIQKIGGGIAAFFKSLAQFFMPIIDPVTRFFSFISVMLINLNKSLKKANIHSFIDGIIKRLGPLGKIISNIGKFFNGFLDGYFAFLSKLPGGIKKIDKDGRVYINSAKITFKTFFEYLERLIVNTPFFQMVARGLVSIYKIAQKVIPFIGRLLGTTLGVAVRLGIAALYALRSILNSIGELFGGSSGSLSSGISKFISKWDAFKKAIVSGDISNILAVFDGIDLTKSSLFVSISKGVDWASGKLIGFFDWVKRLGSSIAREIDKASKNATFDISSDDKSGFGSFAKNVLKTVLQGLNVLIKLTKVASGFIVQMLPTLSKFISLVGQMFKNLGKNTEFFAKVQSSLSGFASKFKAFIDGFINSISYIDENGKRIIDNTKITFSAFFDYISSKIKNFIKDMDPKTLLKPLIIGVGLTFTKSVFGSIFGARSSNGLAGSIATGIINPFAAALPLIFAFFSLYGDTLKQKIKECIGWDDTKDPVENITGWITSAIDVAKEKFKVLKDEFIKNGIPGIVDTIKSQDGLYKYLVPAAASIGTLAIGSLIKGLITGGRNSKKSFAGAAISFIGGPFVSSIPAIVATIAGLLSDGLYGALLSGGTFAKNGLAATLPSIAVLFGIRPEDIKKFIEEIKEAFENNDLGKFFKENVYPKTIDAAKKKWNEFLKWIKTISKNIGTKWDSLVSSITFNSSESSGGIKGLISSIAKGLAPAIGVVGKSIPKVITLLKGLLDSFKPLIKPASEFSNILGIMFKNLYTGFEGEKVTGFFSGLGDKLKSFATFMDSVGKAISDFLSNFISTFATVEINGEKFVDNNKITFSNFFTFLGNGVKDAYENTKKGFNRIKDTIIGILKPIVSFLLGVDWNKHLETIMSIANTLFAFNIGRGLKLISNAVVKFSDGLFVKFGGKKDTIGTTLLKIAGALTLFAYACNLIGRTDTTGLATNLDTIIAKISELVAIIYGIQHISGRSGGLSSAANSITEGLKNIGESIAEFGKGMLMLAGALTIMTVLWSIAGLRNGLKSALATIAVLGVGLAAIQIVIANIASKSESGKAVAEMKVIIDICAGVLMIAAAIAGLAFAIKKIDDQGAITQAEVIVGVALVALGTLVGLLGNWASKGESGVIAVSIKGILTMSIGLWLITQSFVQIARLAKHNKNIAGAAVIIGAWIAELGATAVLIGKYASNVKSSSGNIASIGMMAVAITAIALSLSNTLDSAKGLNSTTAIAIMAGLTLIISAIGLTAVNIGSSAKSFKDASGTFAIIAALGGSIALIAYTLGAALENAKGVDWRGATALMSGLVICVISIGIAAAELSKVTAKLENVGGTAILIVALGAAIWLMASSIGDAMPKLKGIDWQLPLSFMVGLAALVFVISKIVPAIGAVDTGVLVKGIIAVFAIITVLGAAVGLFIEISAAAIDSMATSLWLLASKLKTMSESMAKVNMTMVKSKLDMLKDTIFPLLTGIITSYQDGWLLTTDNLVSVANNIRSFSWHLSNVKESNSANLTALADNTKSFIDKMNKIENVSSVTDNLTAITGALNIYSTALNSVANIGTDENGSTKQLNKKTITDAFNAIKDIIPVDSINEIASYGENGAHDLNPMILGIGALGAAIEAYGKNIGSLKKDDVDNAKDVISSVTGIYDYFKENSILLKLVTALSNNRDPMTKFGGDLGILGGAIQQYGESIDKLNPLSIIQSGILLTMIKGLQDRLPITGAFWTFITGEKSIGDFASNISALGDGINQYADYISKSDFSKNENALRTVERIADVVNGLTKSGGAAGLLTGNKNIGVIADGLPSLGEKLVSFQTNITDIDYDKLKPAVTIIERLASAYSLIDPDMLNLGAYGQGPLELIGNDLSALLSHVATSVDSEFDDNQTIGDKLSGIGTKIIGIISDGITDSNSENQNGSNSISDGLNSVLGSSIESSKTDSYQSYYDAGKYFVNSIALGIGDENTGNELARSLRVLAETMVRNFKGSLNTAFSSGSSVSSQVSTGVANVVVPQKTEVGTAIERNTKKAGDEISESAQKAEGDIKKKLDNAVSASKSSLYEYALNKYIEASTDKSNANASDIAIGMLESFANDVEGAMYGEHNQLTSVADTMVDAVIGNTDSADVAKRVSQKSDATIADLKTGFNELNAKVKSRAPEIAASGKESAIGYITSKWMESSVSSVDSESLNTTGVLKSFITSVAGDFKAAAKGEDNPLTTAAKEFVNSSFNNEEIESAKNAYLSATNIVSDIIESGSLKGAGKQIGGEIAGYIPDGLSENLPGAVAAISGEIINNTPILNKGAEILGKAIDSGLLNGISTDANSPISTAAEIVTKLLDAANKAADVNSPSKKTAWLGQMIVKGLVNGMQGEEPKALKVTKQIASSIINSIKSTLKIHSPSKVTEQLGYYTVQGYANGINKGRTPVSRAATKVTKVVLYALDPNKNNIGTENLGSDVAGRIATDLQDGTQNIKSEGTGLINTVDYFTTELSSIANANYSGTFLYKGDVKKESEDYYDDVYESDNAGAEKVLNNREMLERRFNSNNLLIRNYDLDKAKSDYESGKSVSKIVDELAESAKHANTSPVSKNLSKNLNNNLNTNLNTDGLKNQLSDVTKDIKLPGDDGSSNSILDGITSAIDGFLDPKNLGPIAGDFEAIFDPNNKDGLFGKIDAFGSFKELFDSIIGKDENGNIKNPFSGFFDEAKGAFAQFIASNDPTGFLSGLGDSFIEGFNNFFGIGDQAGKEGEEGAKSVFDTILDGIKTAVTDAAGTITDIFGKSGEESAENPLNGLAGAMQEGITTQANAVDADAAVKDLGTNLATSVPTSIESAAQANDLVGGLESVLKGNFDKIDVNTVTNDLISGINNRLTNDINGTPTLTPIFDMSNFSANAPIIRKSLGIDDMKLEIAATTSAALANGIVIGKIETGLGELKTSFDNYTSAMGKTVGGLSSKIDSLDRDIMNLKIYLDSDALVAGTVDKMNRELGKKKFQASRVGSK